MRPASFISFVGFVMLIAATYCPLFRPLHITNWDMYACNKPYGIVVLLVAVVGIIGCGFYANEDSAHGSMAIMVF